MNPFDPSTMLIWRVLLPPLLIILVWVIYLKVLISRSAITAASIALLPVIFTFVALPHLWWLAVFLAISANLIFPGLPQGIPLGHALALGFTGMILLRTAILKQATVIKLEKRSFLYALGIVLVTILTIAVRGFGLRVFGGGGWGGAAYIRMFIAFGFLLASETVFVKVATWRRYVWVLLLITAVPAIAQLVFLLSNGEITIQYNFIRPEGWALNNSLQALGDEKMVRYYGYSGMAYGLTALALTRAHRYLTLLGLTGVMVLNMLSGFRTSVTTTILVVTLYLWFVSGPRRMQRVTILAATCLVAAVLIYPFVQHLPLAMQRSLAFIPFYEISQEAAFDAQVSTQWRLQIWAYVIRNIPQYLLVGKGVLIQEELTNASAMFMVNTPLFAYEWHNYHNGPLGILHDYGAFGLLAVVGFLFVSSREFLRWQKLFIPGQFIYRFYIFLLAYYLTQVINFLLFYGDVSDSIPNLIFSATLVRCVARTQKAQIQADSKLAPASTAASGPPSPEPGTGPRFPLQL